ncbi:MAG: DUF5060 domain-containing protein [Thalassobius sp.]|nr:DUF5060 domain-containing protein [Thalassovita sp.]
MNSLHFIKKLLITTCFFVISSSVSFSQTEQWDIYEVVLKAKTNKNPYTEVNLSATFQYKNRQIEVSGFYDGEENYKIRFMPDKTGEWIYLTKSNVKALDGKKGKFTCVSASPNNHGPVKVKETFQFEYTDGTPYYPVGTTSYAWTSMSDELINQTIETLSNNAFNKIRMCVFPKIYSTYIRTDPQYYPFEGTKEDGWNYDQFNPKFFQHLERCIDSLRALNIEADLILFHPYDFGTWGFDRMPDEVNDRYLRYIIARLGSYRNIWWSLCNEFEIMKSMDMDDWDRLFKITMEEDPYMHLRSIHNAIQWYDYTKPWVTHLSLQTIELLNIQKWRNEFQKPVVIDECVYEGNIPTDWGNLTGEEMLERFWVTYTRGGYATHGETYLNADTVLWWSKGGKLYGKSPERIDFMRSIMEDAPADGVVPYESAWNKSTYLYKGDEYFLHYFGNAQQVAASLDLPEDKKYTAEIIDTWNMTITKAEGVYSGKAFVDLPQKPYLALRVRAVKE